MLIANLRLAVINDQIKADNVRLIDADGSQMGIVPLAEALRRAAEKELDLVQMAADSQPMVCRLMDYGKHLFELKKSQAVARKRQHKQQSKEVKFRLGTDNADYQVKLRRLTGFLAGGDKAKVTIHLRGREMLHRDKAIVLLERIAGELESVAKLEQESYGDERNLSVVLLPLRRPGTDKKKAGEQQAAADVVEVRAEPSADRRKHAEA